MSTATLHVGHGARRVTREELLAIETPEPTKTWRPVPHHALVQALVDEFQGRGIEVVSEQYCTKNRDRLLLGVLDLKCELNTVEFSMGLGVKAGNELKTAIHLLGAAKVFVCSNEMLMGSDAVCLRRKHTSGFDLKGMMPKAVDAFLHRAGDFRAQILAMQEILLQDSRVKELLYDAFVWYGVAPLRLLPRVACLYFADEEQRGKFPERSLYSVNNAFTEAFKELPRTSQFAAGQRLGRFFSETMNWSRPLLRNTTESVSIQAQLEQAAPEPAPEGELLDNTRVIEVDGETFPVIPDDEGDEDPWVIGQDA